MENEEPSLDSFSFSLMSVLLNATLSPSPLSKILGSAGQRIIELMFSSTRWIRYNILFEGDTSFGTALPGAVEHEVLVVLTISLESDDEDAITPEEAGRT